MLTNPHACLSAFFIILPWRPQKEFHPRGGIIITENGCAVAEDDVDEALKDIERAVYLKRYLTEVRV
jgi:beta-glucosidase/6-phospho-beta-glucosidase/beta-galactosidase